MSLELFSAVCKDSISKWVVGFRIVIAWHRKINALERMGKFIFETSHHHFADLFGRITRCAATEGACDDVIMFILLCHMEKCSDFLISFMALLSGDHQLAIDIL